jgi:hypothetical protein
LEVADSSCGGGVVSAAKAEDEEAALRAIATATATMPLSLRNERVFFKVASNRYVSADS